MRAIGGLKPNKLMRASTVVKSIKMVRIAMKYLKTTRCMRAMWDMKSRVIVR